MRLLLQILLIRCIYSFIHVYIFFCIYDNKIIATLSTPESFHEFETKRNIFVFFLSNKSRKLLLEFAVSEDDNINHI